MGNFQSREAMSGFPAHAWRQLCCYNFLSFSLLFIVEASPHLKSFRAHLVVSKKQPTPRWYSAHTADYRIRSYIPLLRAPCSGAVKRGAGCFVYSFPGPWPHLFTSRESKLSIASCSVKWCQTCLRTRKH